MDRSAARLALVGAKQSKQTNQSKQSKESKQSKQYRGDALAQARYILTRHSQWVASHLTEFDGEVIRHVTGEEPSSTQEVTSLLALILAESRLAEADSSRCETRGRSEETPGRLGQQLEHVTSFTAMRNVISGGVTARALDSGF